MKNILISIVILFISLSVYSQENFDNFYSRFCTDIVFQMERINFPLKGTTVEEDMDMNRTYRKWRQSDWGHEVTTYYDPILKQCGFKTEVNRSTYEVYIRIYEPNTENDSQMVFELIRNKWYLTKCYDSY